jgi:CRP-like cAMP-binding protein
MSDAAAASLIKKRAMPVSCGSRPVGKQAEHGRNNRFLATLPSTAYSLLAPHLRTVPLKRGVTLYETGEKIEQIYFPDGAGMVSLLAITPSGASVESASVGRDGVLGASAGLGPTWAIARAVVQLPGTAASISAAHFRAAAAKSQTLREQIVRYNNALLAQIQQAVVCNAVHSVQARLCRWLLQAHECIDGDAIPATQDFLAQTLGVRRTTVTSAARLLQSAGVIRYRRGHIQVLDRSALVDISCECHAVIRQNADKVFSLGSRLIHPAPAAPAK